MDKKFAAVTAAVALLTGCLAHARVDSVKRPGYDKKLGRCLVVFAPEQPGVVESFRRILAAELKARGVEPSYAQVDDGRSLEWIPSLTEQAKAVGATTVLEFEPVGPKYRGFSARNHARVFDVATEQVVWGATVSFESGSFYQGPDECAHSWVRKVILALITDGLLEGPPMKPLHDDVGPRPTAAGWSTAPAR